MSNSDAEAASTMGRRERKRLLTRKQIARTAIELFDEKGFAEVTIAEIAERADVDPSTFFRHFPSKEAVIYGDYEEFLGRLGGVLRARPAKERLPTSLKHAIGQLVTDLMVSPEDELRRMRVAQASPDLRAQALAFREDLATDFAAAIAERMGVDVETDPQPYLLASLWLAAADWYRAYTVRTGVPAESARDAVEQITAFVNSLAPTLKR